jgi:hypothetical protein
MLEWKFFNKLPRLPAEAEAENHMTYNAAQCGPLEVRVAVFELQTDDFKSAEHCALSTLRRCLKDITMNHLILPFMLPACEAQRCYNAEGAATLLLRNVRPSFSTRYQNGIAHGFWRSETLVVILVLADLSILEEPGFENSNACVFAQYCVKLRN